MEPLAHSFEVYGRITRHRDKETPEFVLSLVVMGGGDPFGL